MTVAGVHNESPSESESEAASPLVLSVLPDQTLPPAASAAEAAAVAAFIPCSLASFTYLFFASFTAGDDSHFLASMNYWCSATIFRARACPGSAESSPSPPTMFPGSMITMPPFTPVFNPVEALADDGDASEPQREGRACKVVSCLDLPLVLFS